MLLAATSLLPVLPRRSGAGQGLEPRALCWAGGWNEFTSAFGSKPGWGQTACYVLDQPEHPRAPQAAVTRPLAEGGRCLALPEEILALPALVELTLLPSVQPLSWLRQGNVRKNSSFEGEKALNVKSEGNAFPRWLEQNWAQAVCVPARRSPARGGGFSHCVCGYDFRLISERDGNLFNRSTSLWVYFVKLMKFCALPNVQSRKSAIGVAFAVSQSCLHN